MRLLYNLLFVCHAAHAVRVCTTLDLGFNMLRDPALSIADVASDGMLRGFDVDMREQVLSQQLNWTYSLRVLPSYGELMVATRKQECDLGWAPFFVREADSNPRPFALLDPGSLRPLLLQSAEGRTFESHSGRSFRHEKSAVPMPPRAARSSRSKPS
jgi:hypothetical protein